MGAGVGWGKLPKSGYLHPCGEQASQRQLHPSVRRVERGWGHAARRIYRTARVFGKPSNWHRLTGD